VQNYFVESRVAIMPMRPPAAGAQIHLNITGAGHILSELHHSTAEIRSAFEIVEPGMKNPYRDAVQGVKLIAKQSLVLPNGLE
jgi:hypothetical protein